MIKAILAAAFADRYHEYKILLSTGKVQEMTMKELADCCAEHANDAVALFKWMQHADKEPGANETIKGLLEIITSDHIKRCEDLARAHGYELDSETAEEYGAIIKAAKGAVDAK